jgi:hypothetical protein
MRSALSLFLTAVAAPFAGFKRRTSLALTTWQMGFQTRWQRRKLHRQVVARIKALRRLEQQGVYVYNRGGVVALQSNSQPISGTTATQPVPPSLAPEDIAAIKEQMVPTIARFRENSSPMKAALDRLTFNVGDTKSARIASVGLGYMIVCEWTMVINLANANVGAQSVNVSPVFPYNLINQTQIGINGGATIYSASGLASFVTAFRNRAACWLLTSQGGLGPALSPALVRITVGANLTATNSTAAAPSMSGLASISVAASTNGNLTVVFYTFHKIALDRESLLGALPLQNNSTFATIQHQLVNLLIGTGATNHKTPFGANANITATFNTAAICDMTYRFWSVPQDPALYQDMVQNSFQIQEQANLTVAATGSGALVYPVPQNQYLVAAHIWAYDNNNLLLPAGVGGLSRIVLQYNAGGIIPVVEFAGRQRAEQFLDYGDDRQAFNGYRWWDGEATTEDLTDADQAGWIDTYSAATPQFLADVAAAVAVPVVYGITRESVVAGAVQVVGG